jgi:hypothetical protein
VFIVVGILSILAGCFVFNQAYSAINIALALNRSADAGVMIALVAIGLILSGAFAVASKDGLKRSFLFISFGVCFLAFLISITHFVYNILLICTFVTLGLLVFYVILICHLDRKTQVNDQPEFEEFFDPDCVNKYTDNDA